MNKFNYITRCSILNILLYGFHFAKKTGHSCETLCFVSTMILSQPLTKEMVHF